MRTCCQCGALDHEVPTSALNAKDEPIIEHFVKPEIREIKCTEDLTRRLMRQGFKHRAPFQGKQVIERMICIACINENDLRDRVWEELKRDARRLERKLSADMDYYAVLNEV